MTRLKGAFEMAAKEHKEHKEKTMKDRMTGFTGWNGHQWDGSHAQNILFILFILSKLRALCVLLWQLSTAELRFKANQTKSDQIQPNRGGTIRDSCS